MTREEIILLEGRSLDLEVAIRVFETPYEICFEGDSDSGFDFFVHVGAGMKVPLPRYSADIEAAWHVVECMEARGFVFVPALTDEGCPVPNSAVFKRLDQVGECRDASCWAEAIARAALLAVCGDGE